MALSLALKKAWRQRGFSDGMADRRTSEDAARRAGDEALEVYLQGVRAGARERAKVVA